LFAACGLLPQPRKLSLSTGGLKQPQPNRLVNLSVGAADFRLGLEKKTSNSSMGGTIPGATDSFRTMAKVETFDKWAVPGGERRCGLKIG